MEADNNHISNYLPTLLSLPAQYYHRCRWIYDVQKNTMIDTWALLAKEIGERKER
jgi:hypothetical protein